MSNKWVADASPLILLGKIDSLELLSRLCSVLIVPSAVREEIAEGPASDPARLWLENAGAVFVRTDPPLVEEIAAWDLGAGETAALGWAFHHRDFEILLDDRAARKCASIHNLKFRGVLGVILAARQRGLIPSAAPLCHALTREGLLIDPSILQKALALVGE